MELLRKGIFKQFAGFLEKKQASLQESENLPPRKQQESSDVGARSSDVLALRNDFEEI